jgi:hypothetical protein
MHITGTLDGGFGGFGGFGRSVLQGRGTFDGTTLSGRRCPKPPQ